MLDKPQQGGGQVGVLGICFVFGVQLVLVLLRTRHSLYVNDTTVGSGSPAAFLIQSVSSRPSPNCPRWDPFELFDPRPAPSVVPQPRRWRAEGQ